MATLQEQLEQSVQKYAENADKVHTFINGTEAETIESASGNKPTIAKIIKDTETQIDTSTGDFNAKASQVTADKETVERLKAETQAIVDNLTSGGSGVNLDEMRQNISKNTTDISSLNEGFSNSNSPNGYTKLPNGIIIQWGNVQISQNYLATCRFPIAFPNHTHCITSGHLNVYKNSPGAVMDIKSYSDPYFKAECSNGEVGNFFYIAIGD